MIDRVETHHSLFHPHLNDQFFTLKKHSGKKLVNVLRVGMSENSQAQLEISSFYTCLRLNNLPGELHAAMSFYR